MVDSDLEILNSVIHGPIEHKYKYVSAKYLKLIRYTFYSLNGCNKIQ